MAAIQIRKRRGTSKEHRGLFQRSGDIWWLRFTFEGKQKFVSLKTTDFTTARANADKILAHPQMFEMAGWQPVVFAYCNKVLLHGDKSQRKRSRESTQYVLNKFFHWSGVGKADEITKGTAYRYIAFLKNERHLAHRSIHTYHARLKKFFDYLIQERRIRTNPFADIPLPKIDALEHQPKRVLAIDVVKNLIRSCRNRDLKFILFCGFSCGMRKNEIVNSRPSWFNLETGRVEIPAKETVNISGKEIEFRTKGKSFRRIPLSKNFLRFLKTYRKHFFNSNIYMLGIEKPHWVARYRHDFRTAFENYLKRKGVACTTHEMRHTFITHALDNGNEVEKVAAWAGDRIRTIEGSYWHPDSVKGNLDFY